MKFSVEMRGFSELMGELLDLPVKADASIARTMNFVAQSMAQRAQAKIRAGGRSGHIYQTDRGPHQASAPGEAPANLTGALVASISFTRMTDRPGSFATAGSTIAYAETLEFGGFSDFNGKYVYVQARPFLLPSFEEAILQAETVLKREFERGLR